MDTFDPQNYESVYDSNDDHYAETVDPEYIRETDEGYVVGNNKNE